MDANKLKTEAQAEEGKIVAFVKAHKTACLIAAAVVALLVVLAALGVKP